MEVRHGNVRNLVNTIEVRGGGESAVSTSYVVAFTLDQQQVTGKFTQPILINPEDGVRISGVVKNNVFTMLAFDNLTTGVRADEGANQMIVIGIVLLIFSFVTLSFSTLLSTMVSCVFIGFGAYYLVRGLSILKAARVLDAARAASSTTTSQF